MKRHHPLACLCGVFILFIFCLQIVKWIKILMKMIYFISQNTLIENLARSVCKDTAFNAVDMLFRGTKHLQILQWKMLEFNQQ